MMQLVSRPKSSSGDGQRSVSVKETLERIEPLVRVAGITRVADITGLDRVGINVFSSIRPEAEGGAISVYNGKGLTADQARVSAIMEGIERYSAEMHQDRVERRRWSEKPDALDPRELIIPMDSHFLLRRDPVLGWSRMQDLMTGAEIDILASAVYHPYLPGGEQVLMRSNTNGLASGNNLEEAVLHGLCEVIERDAWSLCEGRRRINSDLTIDVPAVKKVAKKFTDKGIELHFKDMTSDIGMPVIAVAADDVEMKDPGLLTLGVGAHPDPKVAAVKALVEVAQSRLTQIHGAREDTVHADRNRELGYERVKKMNRLWFEDTGRNEKLSSLEDISTDDVLDDITTLNERLAKVGIRHLLVKDLTRAELAVPVVRVVVPGLELYSIDPDRVGTRMMGARK